ncbi:MAG: UBP-type zinc finger domain-containing protein, partial [Thermoproteota archaeon]|nr:UBP-type zinc finger domain-containing protein [Thermoproteota archaeon]
MDREQKTCCHAAQANNNITSRTEVCDECAEEETGWIARRLCLTRDHVSCYGSSTGRHATRHFVETEHPITTA